VGFNAHFCYLKVTLALNMFFGMIDLGYNNKNYMPKIVITNNLGLSLRNREVLQAVYVLDE